MQRFEYDTASGEAMKYVNNIPQTRPKILYTIGYGNRKPDELIKILKDNGIETVVDVRREGSKAWCRDYWTSGTGYIGIRKTLTLHHIFVENAYELGNYYDTLEEYKNAIGELREHIACLYCIIKTHLGPLCLLCAEIDPEKCHRSIIAEELQKLYGFGIVNL